MCHHGRFKEGKNREYELACYISSDHIVPPKEARHCEYDNLHTNRLVYIGMGYATDCNYIFATTLARHA